MVAHTRNSLTVNPVTSKELREPLDWQDGMVPDKEKKIERQNVAKAYTVGSKEKKAYAGTLPLYNKCKLHHVGPCTVKCGNYKRVDHMTRDYKTPVPATTQRAPIVNPKATVTCYECRKDYKTPVPATTQRAPIVNLKAIVTCYECRNPLIDIIPTTLDTKYTIELADGKIIGADTIIRGCTLNFLNHPFNIDLMLVDLGSFNVIIGMDWLTKYHTVIICNKMIVCIPFDNEILTIQGDRSDDSRANERPPMLEKGDIFHEKEGSEDEYQGELQGDSQEDKLTTTMMLLSRAITQKFSTPTNNHLRTSSNTRNQAVVQDGRVDTQTKNLGHYARDCQKPRVCDAKYFKEQMLLAMKDEAGSILKDEENDFMLDNSYGEETMEELTVVVMLMAQI
nr:reverse transcriptase domain-containing protein [Tanacetum cinerariifolium]